MAAKPTTVKRIKKGFKIYPPRRESWFGDQLLKVSALSFGVIVVLVVGGVLLYEGVSRSVFFQIEEVSVKGCNRTTPRQILAWSGLDVQTNLWTVRIGRVRDKLEEKKWIARAHVARDWPNKLLITVRERQEVAIVSSETDLQYVDKQGVLFGSLLPEDVHDYPVITGYQMVLGGKDVRKKSIKDALAFIKYAGKGSAVLPKQNISEINLSPEGELTLFIADHPFPIFIGKGDMHARYQRLTRVLSWLYRKKKFEAATMISMNYMQETGSDQRNRVLVQLSE